jgi:hypothetical protein
MERIRNDQGKRGTSYVDCAYGCPKRWALILLDHHSAIDPCSSLDRITHLAPPRPSWRFHDKAIP